MGEAMEKVDHLVARAFKSAMAFVLAVGLCPVAPAMAQEGATANEEGGTAAAAADGADVSTDRAGTDATGAVVGSETDGVQPGGVSGDGDAAADGAGVGASAQDAAENDATDSGVSVDAAEAADATDGEADESNDAAAQTDGWQAWGGCEWMVDSEGCLTIRPKDGAEVGQLPNVAGCAPWCVGTYAHSIESVKVEKCVKTSDSADDLFKDLSAAVTMDLSGLDVSSATNMSYMFRDCRSLSSLVLSGWDASSATNMRGMFSGCGSLASLDLSGWDASKVTDMSSMFSGCSSLASLDLSGWDTSSVTNMSSMFSGCSSLASLDLSSFDDSSLKSDTYRSDMFDGCVILERILVGEHFALRDLMPEPSSIEGWTGKWVNEAGSAFTSGEVPVGKKDIYRAQIGLNADMFTVDCSDSVYTGYEITKAVLSSKLLEGLDYNVSYSSNVYVGIASINITGIGRATGALHYEFNITKAKPEYESPAPVEAAYGQTLSDVALPKGFSWQDDPSTSVGELGEREFLAMFTPGDAANYEVVRDVPVKVRVTRDIDASMFSVDAAGLVYDGSAHEPAVSSAVVPEGSYSVGYRDNVSAGEAAAVVSGSGFYRGSCELEFAIAKATPDYEAPAPVEAAYGQTLSDVALPKGFSWQDGDIVVDWYGKKTLFVRFTPNDQANYNSIDGIPVDVVARHKDLKTAEIKFEGSQFEYTGHLVKPSPSIAMDGESLVEGVDYSVEYRNNVLPGKAEALVCGMGRFAGSSVGVSFDIVRSAGNYIALPGHWATGSGGWWYPYDNGGYPANEWCIIDDAYYHFNGSGYMQTGWLNLGSTWYYLSGSGIMQTGWQKIGGSWYWFDDSGAMASGWRVIDGSYYYFSGSGAMQTGWLNTGGAWYYLSGSGAMATGWLSLGGTWYWFDDSGAMASGWSVIDGSYYYFNGSGAMQTGWLSYGGAWYWLGDSGAMATGWKWIGGSCYYFDGSGAMQANKWIDGSYVDSDGRWAQNA